MPLFDEFHKRGLVHQCTDEGLSKRLEKPLTFYVGFDPTADSLHIGNLMPLLIMKRLQDAGHSPIAVVGGATGMIGDPSGKTQERSLMDTKALQKNLKGVEKDIGKILDTSGKKGAKILNNSEWIGKLSALEFMRDVGKHFTVNHMVAKESVRARLEDRDHGISYTEFSYMLIQAYDFYYLNKKYGCVLQLGGSDQWGNITAGCELIRRVRAAENKPAEEVFGMTNPLITKSDGTKFGKTESGTVWMSASRTSPYALYQYFLQTSDSDAITWLKYLTLLGDKEIAELEQSQKAAPEKREAQRALARAITELLHGKKETTKAEAAGHALFGEDVNQLDEDTLLSVFANAPATSKKRKDLKPEGIPVLDLLVETKLCGSKGAARRDVSGGGIYLNNRRIADPAATLQSDGLIAGKYVLLRKGKKNVHLVSFS